MNPSIIIQIHSGTLVLQVIVSSNLTISSLTQFVLRGWKYRYATSLTIPHPSESMKWTDAGQTIDRLGLGVSAAKSVKRCHIAMMS